MILYHGTTKEKAENIVKGGFSLDFQGENGNHFGRGIYLTTTKKRAKCYGKAVVSVEIQADQIATWENWYTDYMKRCNDTHEQGVPAEKVNEIVGESIRSRYEEEGHTGLLLDALIGNSKEVVVYDHLIIKRIWN